MKQVGFKDAVIAAAWESKATWHVEVNQGELGADVRLVAVKADGSEAAAALFECKLKDENSYAGTDHGQLSQLPRQAAILLLDGKRVDVAYYVTSRLGSAAPRDGPTISIQRILGVFPYDQMKCEWPNLRRLLQALPKSTLDALEAGEGFPRGLVRLLNGLAADEPAFFKPDNPGTKKNINYQHVVLTDDTVGFIVEMQNTHEVRGMIPKNSFKLEFDAATGQLVMRYDVMRYIGPPVNTGRSPASQIPSLVDPANYQAAGTVSFPLGSIMTVAGHRTLVAAVSILRQIALYGSWQGW
ncbi:MAG: hypothetical protein Q6370_018830 [Candidatus Sigynarchaeota archaeon]